MEYKMVKNGFNILNKNEFKRNSKSCVDCLCNKPSEVTHLLSSSMLFNQGSHGFIKTHKWNNTIGAFINIEASGSGGAGIIKYLFII